MSRQLTLTAEAKDPMSLRMNWISGEGADGLEFDLDCGAGLGSSELRLTVRKGEARAVEVIDIRDLVQQWVDGVAGDMGKEPAP